MYKRIKDLREDNDLSQEKLAEVLNMHRTQYRRYESGARELPFNIAIMLAKYYNVSLDYIAGLTNEKKPLP
jgi:transcriptional regulator with XRE-family HTH domain